MAILALFSPRASSWSIRFIGVLHVDAQVVLSGRRTRTLRAAVIYEQYWMILLPAAIKSPGAGSIGSIWLLSCAERWFRPYGAVPRRERGISCFGSRRSQRVSRHQENIRLSSPVSRSTLAMRR